MEENEKARCKKRKTVLYLRRLLMEAGINCTDVKRLTRDWTMWKKFVRDRTSHLERWKR